MCVDESVGNSTGCCWRTRRRRPIKRFKPRTSRPTCFATSDHVILYLYCQGRIPMTPVSISFACLHPRSVCQPQFTRTPLVRDDRRKAPQVVIWSSSVDPHRPRRRRCSRPVAQSCIGPWTQAPTKTLPYLSPQTFSNLS